MRSVSADGELVRVRLFAAAKAAAGISEVDVKAGTIGSINDELIARHASLAHILPACSFLIDGMQTAGHGRSMVVDDGSVLDVLPPFAGG